MDFWRTKTFRLLVCEWNQKLKETGFNDAETDSRGDRVLKQRATNSYRQADDLERETRLQYFLILGHFVNNSIFPTDLEELIMRRHADGATITEIVEEIKSLGISRDRKTVRHIIRRWQMKWGIKIWTHKQMKLKR